MGLFKTLNAHILAVLSKRSHSYQIICVAFVNYQIIITLSNGHQYSANWADLKRVIALRRDLYIGEEVSLLLEFSPTPIVEISDSCQGWDALCATIDNLQNAKNFCDWYAQILSVPIGQSIEIWARVD